MPVAVAGLEARGHKTLELEVSFESQAVPVPSSCWWRKSKDGRVCNQSDSGRKWGVPVL